MPSSEALDELMVSLQRLGRLLASRQVAAKIIMVAGVKVSQQGMTLLRVLHRDGQLPMATLAASAAMDLGAVSRQIRVLEESGAVERSRDPTDGRVVLLQLTDEGQRIAEKIRAVTVRHLEDALRDWSDADERTLARLIHRLVDDLLGTPVGGPTATAATASTSSAAPAAER